MISPWQNPLLLDEYATSRVVVYFFNSKWVPIMFFSFADALELHRKAAHLGHELFIFPTGLTPDYFDSFQRELADTATSQIVPLQPATTLSIHDLGFSPEIVAG